MPEPAVLGPGLDLGQLRFERPLGRLLHVEVERGVDPEAGPIEIAAEPGLQQLARIFDEVVAHPGKVRPRRQRERVGLPRLGRLARQLGLVAEQIDDQVPPLHVERRVPPRIVAGGAFRNRGERRGLGHVERPGRFAEVPERRGLDAVGPVAEIDLIEIELEDLLLRIAALDVHGDPHLAQLAGQAAEPAPLGPVDHLRPEIPGQLHGHRRKTLEPLPAQDRLDGAEDADPVDPAMLVKAAVFRAQEGRDDGGRHLFEWDYRPPLEAEIRHQPPIGGIDLGGLVRIIGLEAGDRGTRIDRPADVEPGTYQEGNTKDAQRADGEQHPKSDFGRFPPAEESLERPTSHTEKLIRQRDRGNEPLPPFSPAR